jgi:UDP-N-acetylmuramate dehydrogenase
MNIIENTSLKHLNTFGFDVAARYFIAPQSLDEAREALVWVNQHKQNVMVLGEGSNVVLTQNIDAAVIHLMNQEFELVEQDDDFYYVKVGSGMNWHECVQKTLAHEGLENLSLIPGLVGAAPIQNIGAYGVELCDYFYELEALQITTCKSHIFSKSDCQFSYRESTFKNDVRDQFLITSVTFKLLKKPSLVLDYAGVKPELAHLNKEPSPQSVSEAICNLRNQKLPNPKQIGNAGSFFKNPIVSLSDYKNLIKQFPDMVAYDMGDNQKLAAGWLIEKAGWKGKRVGNVAVHDKQALVLVNCDGCGSGQNIVALAADIQASVKNQFGITLEQEPRIY